MATQELRPMGIGDILDATFRLYRQQFVTFLLIALIVHVPYALLMTFTMTAEMSPVTVLPEAGVPPHIQFNPGAFLLSMIPGILFVIVMIPLCTAALIHNISASYLGENLSAGASYSRAAPRLLPLIGTQFLCGLIVFAAFFLLVAVACPRFLYQGS